jgi:hypothetical protein
MTVAIVDTLQQYDILLGRDFLMALGINLLFAENSGNAVQTRNPRTLWTFRLGCTKLYYP